VVDLAVEGKVLIQKEFHDKALGQDLQDVSGLPGFHPVHPENIL
jgi:hypothetical protein